jgi:oligopeptide transport system substrate-binding protein
MGTLTRARYSGSYLPGCDILGEGLMMRSSRRVVSTAVGLAFVGALVLSSCSSHSKEPANTLHISVLTKIKGLDPINADDLYSAEEVGRVYDTLYQYQYLKRPYTLEPAIAESMPELSSDAKTITIKLKKGILFQDDPCFTETGGKGRELTAQDVVYSFERVADPKLSSVGSWIFDGKVAGFNQWHDDMLKAGTTDYSKPLEGFKALDRYTLQIKLAQRNYQFFYVLAMPFAGIVPHEAVEHYGKDFVNHPVGSGPYKLAEFNPGSRLVWDRNPTYRKETYPTSGEPDDQKNGLLADAGKTVPFADRVVVNIIEEDQPRWLNFLSKKLDVLTIPKDNFSQAVGKDGELLPEFKAKGMILQKTPLLETVHITLNMADPLIGKNKYLRQALSLAFDSHGMIDLFYNGAALPAQGVIPPGLAGYDPNYKNPLLEFNIAKAKELMAKAGYPNGEGLPTLEMLSQTDTTDRQINEYMEKQFAQIGVKFNNSEGSWPQFQDSIKAKKGQVWSFSWSADYPDAEDFLQLFITKNQSPGPNDSNYSNPEYDKLYEKSLTLPDSPARTAIYQQMSKILNEDCPWIPFAHRVWHVLEHPWVHGYKYSDVIANRWKYVGVDPALRNK